jgi:hypothetical protein
MTGSLGVISHPRAVDTALQAGQRVPPREKRQADQQELLALQEKLKEMEDAKTAVSFPFFPLFSLCLGSGHHCASAKLLDRSWS